MKTAENLSDLARAIRFVAAQRGGLTKTQAQALAEDLDALAQAAIAEAAALATVRLQERSAASRAEAEWRLRSVPRGRSPVIMAVAPSAASEART